VPDSANDNSPSQPCPLCGAPGPLVTEDLPVRDIDHEYRRQLGVAADKEFPVGLSHLELCCCRTCGLEYYAPLVAGSPGFYAALSRSPKYYSTARWEFEQVAQLLPPEARIVDIGCGDGRFLNSLPQQERRGLELNPEAVKRARAAGLTVSDDPLSQQPSDYFDAVTIFQVLEHVTNPREILGELVRMLRPGAQLFIAVPNNDGFVGRAIQEPLNVAPHHPLRWTRSALHYIPRLFPLKLEWVRTEPVGPDHLFSYRRERITSALAGVSRSRLPLIRLSARTILFRKIANLTTMASLKLSRRLPAASVPGHSYLALLTRA
jgi:SAM-dependent methyltransferase